MRTSLLKEVASGLTESQTTAKRQASIPELEREYSNDERWKLVNRIVSSHQFAKATQLRDILLYISRHTLAGHVEAIHEQEIACNVLGRRADFNPGDDNIVRVQISHLRKKLESYFSLEGSDESLVLTVPKGTYVPHFERRPLAERTAEKGGAASQGQATMPQALRDDAFRDWTGSPRRMWLLLGILGVVLSVFGIYRIEAPMHRSAPAVHATVFPAMENPLLRTIFTPGNEVSTVIADSNLVLMQDLLGTDIALNQYVSKDYPASLYANVRDENVKSVLEKLANRTYTSLGDVSVAMKFGEASGRFNSRIRLRYARHLNIRDFGQGNFIMIGSRRGDPWVGLFEPQLNFIVQQQPSHSGLYFQNKDPQGAEQSTYFPVVHGDVAKVTYVDIALLPNLQNNGSVLLLNGLTMEANEAAADFIFNKDFLAQLARWMDPGTMLASPYIEIFLKATVEEGAATGFQIVSIRHSPAQK